jgi:hypothetical protein
MNFEKVKNIAATEGEFLTKCLDAINETIKELEETKIIPDTFKDEELT